MAGLVGDVKRNDIAWEGLLGSCCSAIVALVL